MSAAARWQARQLLVKQRHRAGIGFELAGDEIEQRRLAGAVGTDDQTPLARREFEIEAAGDTQAAEGFFEFMDRQRGHGAGFSSVDRTVAGAVADFLPRPLMNSRKSCPVPGTRPSGMNMTMATKIAPNIMFQRVI